MMKSLAKSRIKYNKSRTLLTCIAIALTTALLMALGTSAVGLLDANKQQAASVSNVHATYKALTAAQVNKLKNHADVEALEAGEIFASVEYGKMNGFLTYSEELKDGIDYGVGELIKGDYATEENEICGPAAFFERIGIKPEVGEKAEISFRVQGEGQIQTKEFVISGIVSERDISDLNISDSRIAYGAEVSGKLVEKMIPQEQRIYNASVRVAGETELNYDEMCSSIKSIAADIGCNESYININEEYLVTATDPGTETMRIAAAIALLIIVFSGIVIYSIYYVGVITDVQEIGKLKALGASKKQIKRLLMREGFTISVIAVPIGLVIGFLIPYFLLPVIIKKGMEASLAAFELASIDMFSLPVLAAVIIAVLLTVYISMLKPMRMAGKISPVEAIRYQESSRGGKLRKGYININVFRLSKSNLMRNKKRTAVTMITMGMSCVLFMSMAGILNSMRAEDMADRELEGSDFKISLDYALNDEEYPENNLENINKNNPFSAELMKQIRNIEGVEEIRAVKQVPVSSDYQSLLFEESSHISISPFDEEKAELYNKELKRGKLDYEKMAQENGAVFTSDVFMEDYGFEIGDVIDFTVYDGDRRIPLSIKISASVDDGNAAIFVVPEEVYDSLGLKNNSTTSLYIDVDKDKYDDAKKAFQSITDDNESFDLCSRDEEMRIGAMSVNVVKYPMYAILMIIAVIGFMNLINTMITSIITRKKELGMLQAIGLTGKQLTKMLAGEGMVFMAGTLIASMTVGNIFGYLVYLWGKSTGFMSVTAYHYPVWETVALALMLVLGQVAITLFISRRIGRESLIDRIRTGE